MHPSWLRLVVINGCLCMELTMLAYFFSKTYNCSTFKSKGAHSGHITALQIEKH